MRDKRRKPIPFSGNRYSISLDGLVLTKDGEQIESFKSDDGIDLVNLEWFNGCANYSVAVLVMISFGVIPTNDIFWNNIEPLFIDGDKSNNQIQNLTYKFSKGPLESADYPGFYYIPFNLNYGVNRTGTILNLNTGEVKSWATTKGDEKRNSKGGYSYTRVVTDSRKSKILFRHRALCLTFKEYGANVASLVVNHLDGDPTNDAIENLEWTTYKRNNQHALDTGLRTRVKPIEMKDLLTNEVMRFNSAAACGEYLGYSSGDPVTSRLGSKRIRQDMLIFKYEDEDWWDVDVENIEICRAGNDTEFLAMNIFTGQLTAFTSALMGERLLDVDEAVIRLHAKCNRNIPINGYVFRYKVGGEPFPTFTERQLLMFKEHTKRSPNGVIVEDMENNTELFFTTYVEAGKYFNREPKTIRSLCWKNSVVDGRYRFSSFDPRVFS